MRDFFKAGDSQPASTKVNHSQREMPFLAELPAPKDIDSQLIRACQNELDAVNLCIDLSRMADEVICERLGIDKGHFSRIRKGRAHFPTSKRLALMYLCGNRAPIQYEAMRLNCDLVDRSKDQVIRELEAQLAELKRAA